MASAGPLIFGEVLFDCFPDGTRVLGGAPFNVAWHCQAFGLQPLFVSRTGDDAMGQAIAQAMQGWGMDTSALQFDPLHATGIVDVSFSDGEPAYTIVEDSAWDFIDPERVPKSENHSMLYHGSLALRQSVSASSLRELLRNNAPPVFIDVNLRAPWWNQALILDIISMGRWIKLNADELALIVPQLKSTKDRIQHLFATTTVEMLVVTQGEAGALAVTRDESCAVKPRQASVVVDTVGAGDAFCSVLLLGLEKRWPLQMILDRAQEFASAVVGQRGATTQNKVFYDGFTKSWKL
jgi:fructokinase